MTSPPYRTYPAPPSDRKLERLALQARDLAAHTAVLSRRAGLSPGHRAHMGCAANMGSKLGSVLHEAGFRPEGSWKAGARNAVVFAPRLVGVWARVAGGFTA
jgi:hypothetical protein